MEVTRLNFESVLPEIQSAIDTATFLSIDTEFTGLSNEVERPSFDNTAERYEKIRAKSLEFLLVQLGLAIFTYDPEKKVYNHRTYSFYVFPKPCTIARLGQDEWFKCQATSMDILGEGNFDFNKVFKQGIPYLNQYQSGYIRRYLERRRENRLRFEEATVGYPITINDDLKDTVEEVEKQVEAFVADPSAKNVTLPAFNSYVRRILFLHLKHKFGVDNLLYETLDRSIVVRRRPSPEDLVIEEEERVNNENIRLDLATGFSKLITHISQSGKYIVGHNMLLDLCHIIHRFWNPLPENYDDFKVLLHSVFPRIIDTKILIKAPQLSIDGVKFPSYLKKTFLQIQKEPFKLIKLECGFGEEQSYSLDVYKDHDAGYDAFATGVLFQTVINYLGTFKNPPAEHVEPYDDILKNYTNFVYIMRVNSTINLEGMDDPVDRSNVFYISCQTKWTPPSIIKLFSPFGDIQIRWINPYAAYVVLKDRSQVENVKEVLIEKRDQSQYVNTNYRVMTYDNHVRLLKERIQNRRTRFRRPFSVGRRPYYRSPPRSFNTYDQNYQGNEGHMEGGDQGNDLRYNQEEQWQGSATNNIPEEQPEGQQEELQEDLL
uniref:Poly(A)-specific ribonuclease RNA-binding domain-containing protein n=1 Tax=Clastoptera arizonana TaxID=38151 RepID=A0A1B6C3M0_9HEMI